VSPETESKTPRASRSPARRRKRQTRRDWQSIARSTLIFVACTALLDAMVNVRYPSQEPSFWWLIPSTDIAIIYVFFAMMGRLRETVPRWAFFVLTGWLFVVRILRFGDGIQQRYFEQQFTLYTDLPLLPEAVRFVWSTRTFWQFSLGLVGVLIGIVALAYASFQGLRAAERYLRSTDQLYIAAGLFGVCYLANTATPPAPGTEEFYSGGFAAGIFPRIQREAEFIANVRSEKAAQSQRIADTERMIAELPSDLAKLKRADVHLILVESYGRCTFELPAHVRDTRAVFDAFESELTKQGFTIATGILNSSTYGGRSWLAHATLNTAVPTTNQFEYDLVLAKRPKPLARFFRDAGYRTVLIQPGTTRESPQGDIYGFEHKYYSWNFDYQGPEFGWATMADQYVLDFVRRRELAAKKQPLFIEYALVTSHAPWNAIPSIVPDWSRIGNGKIFGELPIQRFPIEWPRFENAGYAYAKTIIYDFDVLRRFIGQFITDGALVVVMGDHQPVWEVNGGSAEFGVPVHVLSRDAELVRPFLARGYVPGIRPQLANYNEGLEKFYPYLLLDFSTPKTTKLQ
jgi:hypothetical protein